MELPRVLLIVQLLQGVRLMNNVLFRHTQNYNMSGVLYLSKIPLINILKMRIFLFFYFFISINIIAQNSGHIEYSHITRFAIDYKTTGLLDFNISVSKYLVLKSNESVKEITSTSEDNNLTIFIPDSEIRPEYFIDLSSNLLLSNKRLFKKWYVLKEDVPEIKWQIKDEFRLFNDIKCQKAIGYFRGRTYTAWFASEIPVPYGPWKLHGLPGLILEAQDDKSEVFLR